ncbi:MAG: C10 family peptidase [Muribaculaceae bacterium]|nr:C10 family peptidase [Muribaculaceae bacterium]
MKKIMFLAVLIMTAMSAMASPVDAMSAKATAQKYLQNQPGKGSLMAPGADGLRLIYEEKSAVKAANAAFYIFNYRNGFVIVSGDDRARDILAYGDRPLDLDRMPDNMKFWLSTYKRQIEYLQEHPGLVVDKQESGRSLRTATVAPMLTAEWDQEAPYYNHCPKYNGSFCLTGCPATSLSMVFYYWKFPTDPTPPVEGYTNASYGFQIEALPSITFDWDNMLDKYTGSYNTAQADAVAWLMRYVGQEEQMDYTPSGSGAMGADILRAVKFFGYDEESARLEFKTRTDDYGNDTATYYTDDEWAALLQNEMAEGRPVVYCAYDYSWFGWSGHAFNVDGYTASTNTYHVNWGWSGDGNGDFALNAFSSGGYTFNIEQQMIMGIQPPPQGPAIKVSPSRLNLEAYVEQSATATFTVKGHELTSDILLTLNDESGFFSIDADHVSTRDQDEGRVITVTYAPLTAGHHTATITLSNAGADDKTVTIEGDATLETFVPVMLPANEAYINLTQFRADWTDETADKYVDSYTLEVNTKPAVQLLDSINATGYTSGYESITLTAPWSGNGTKVGNGAIYFSNYSGDGYIAYTVPAGFNNDVFTMQITTVETYYGSGNITVGSDQTAPVGHQFSTGETYTWLVTASEGEKITITSTDSYFSPDMAVIRVYSGDVNDLLSLRAVAEEGDANYRLVTGIADKNYLVKNLTEAGTFYYRVKALYTDGTQSAWSKSQIVTLFDNGHAYQLGDVNHDGDVNISDVTDLIDYLLGAPVDVCDNCADVETDGEINIADVTALIDMLLTRN